MSRIDIRHPHSQPMENARAAVEEVAGKLTERFGCACRWDGDSLEFSGSGVDGRIDLAPEQVRITAKLGFMLSMLQGPIEAEIRRVLGERFG